MDDSTVNRFVIRKARCACEYGWLFVFICRQLGRDRLYPAEAAGVDEALKPAILNAVEIEVSQEAHPAPKPWPFYRND